MKFIQAAVYSFRLVQNSSNTEEIKETNNKGIQTFINANNSNS